jgi:hypothetical protein
MIDLQPAPVPTLTDEWIVSHRSALVEALEPRHHGPVKWVTFAGAAGVAATVSALVLLGGAQQSAFAGWSASPTAPATGQVSAAESDCQAQLAHPRFVPAGANAVPMRPELSDVRGPYTTTLFGDGTKNEVLCVSASGNAALQWIAQSGTPVNPGNIVADKVYLASDGQPYTMLIGRTGSDVTGVTLSLAKGGTVTATSGNGFFLAWWPGSDAVTSATVETPTGTSTQPLSLAGPGSPADSGTQSVCFESIPALAAQRLCVSGGSPTEKGVP